MRLVSPCKLLLLFTSIEPELSLNTCDQVVMITLPFSHSIQSPVALWDSTAV